MNNLVSSNPFKTYIGTIRVRKKNPHGFQLVFQSPCPRSFFKKTTKPTHFTVEKKISEKNLPSTSLSRNETLSEKLSDSPPVRGRGLLGGLEAYSPRWSHRKVRLWTHGIHTSSPLPPGEGQTPMQVGRWKVTHSGDVLKKNFPWKTHGIAKPGCSMCAVFLATFGNFLW